MKTIKPFEKLSFHDDFMFGHIMHDKDICKTVLEILLDMKIDRIEYPELQKTIAPYYTFKGIRLDVYVEDGNRVYDVELQNSPEVDIGKRTRYYQGMLDIASILRGQKYRELKESIIIFLCRFDPFQKGIPCYTISRTCREDGSIKLNDKSTLYAYNCKSYENAENPELRALLKYIETDITESEFTRRLYSMVEAQKEKEDLKTSYFTWGLFAQDHEYEGMKKGREKGRLEGIEKKAIEDARNLLAMKVLTHEQIAQAIGLPLETVEKLAQEIASEKTV